MALKDNSRNPAAKQEAECERIAFCQQKIASAAHHSMRARIAVRGRGGNNPLPSSTTPASKPPAASAASSTP